MFTIIDGPRASILNDNADGRYAFSDRSELAAHAATSWLLDYAQDNVENHGGSWSDWSEAADLMTCYTIVSEDDETGERRERYLSNEELSPRGMSILAAALQGEDAPALLNLWAEDIDAEDGERWHTLKCDDFLEPIAAWGTPAECAALAKAFSEHQGSEYTAYPMDPEDIRRNMRIIQSEGVNADDALRAI